RLSILWSLVFYFSFTGCSEKKDAISVSVKWEGDKAVAITVPQKFLSSVSKDSVNELLHIHLAKSDQRIIGDYLVEEDKVIFKPIIAFTRGLNYKVYVRNELIQELAIPADNSAVAPEVVAVYPALDTLPENLLKFYLSFSKPMQEGDILQHIHLIKDGRDTMSSVFLDLELWNNERTMLTLWLDPGRIKRDLQPNKLLGPPLNKGSHYQLVIDKEWQDAEGILLKENFTRNFFTGPHDSVSPDVELWTISAPRSETREQLKINFNEPLDHVLAESTILVTNANGNEVKGKPRVSDDGTILYFVPDIEWKPAIYKVQIESRLEDLAGNNLDRLFDTDLTQKPQAVKNIHKREFEVRK
ncbi:MAG TPA: Ig-like domain-containing protein, partial [Chitinophagaceae bacterium]